MDYQKRNKKILLLAAAALFYVVNTSFAIDMPNIDRSKVRLYIKAGQAKEGEIVVDNNSDDLMTVRAYLQDWQYSLGDGTKEFLPAGTMVHSCASWISFSPTDFTLAPSGRKRVRYNVKVPEGANGAYYAVLFFENVVGKLEGEASKQMVGLNLAVRFATLFYIEVDGTAQLQGDLENIFLKKAGLYAPLLINGDFKNSGNIDIMAGGVFAIMDSSGRVRGRGNVADVYTMPSGSAKLKGIWRESLDPGDYTFILTMDLGKAGHKSYYQRGPFIIKEVEMRIAQDGSLTDFHAVRE